MKRVLILSFLTVLILSGCKNTAQLSRLDDVYFDPKRDKELMAPPKKEEPEMARTEVKPEQKQVEDNPYYKDPSFSSDDYYDSEYAARLRRFNNPLYGVGYYDSYYTNSYFYNQNPYQYGVSIYNGYNWWGPSYYNYMYTPNYNWGNWYGMPSQPGFNMYFGNTYNYYNYYDPWGNCGWNYYGSNPYYYNNYYWGMGNPYWNNSYWNGYYNGYYNGFYNGYYSGLNNGYYNSYDYNSLYYGPRKSRTGSNGNQDPGDGKLMAAGKPVKEEIQFNDPTNPQRFNAIPFTPKSSANGTAPVKGGNYNTPHTSNPNYSEPRPNMAQPRNSGNNTSFEEPVKNQPIKKDTPREWNMGNQNNDNPSRPPIKFDNEPRNSGGFDRPADSPNKSGNNGGGTTRPRK